MSREILFTRPTVLLTMFETNEFPSYEELMQAYAKESTNYVLLPNSAS